MLRKVVGAMVLGALAACSELPSTICRTNDDCASGSLCDERLQRCVVVGSVPQQPDAGACEPACSAFQVCTAESGSPTCVSRYTALSLVRPAAGSVTDGGEVQVEARLVPRSASETSFPPSLDFSATRAGGGDEGTWSSQQADGGTYLAQWTPPAGDGTYTLQAEQPDSSLSAQVQVVVDRSPPELWVTVGQPPQPAEDGGFSFTEPDASVAWPRDQRVQVSVASPSEDLDPDSVRVTVFGHGQTGPSDGGTALALARCDGGAAWCGTYDLALWEPSLPAFSGEFRVEATARDSVGNESRDDATIPVTRWKWVFDAAGVGTFQISSPPAINSKGVVYLATAAGPIGRVHALAPSGKPVWNAPVEVGAIYSGPIVGAESNAGVPTVYVSTTNSISEPEIYVLNGNDGTERMPVCRATGMRRGSYLGLTELGSLETAVSVVSPTSGTNGTLLVARPEAPSGSRCVQVSLTNNRPYTASLSPLVVKGPSFYFVNASLRVTGFSWDGFSTSLNQLWSVSPNGTSPLPVGSLAMNGTDLVGTNGLTATSGQLFTLSTTATPPPPISWRYPSSADRLIRPVAIGQDGVAFFGMDEWPVGSEVQPVLGALALGAAAPEPSTATVTDPVQIHPVLGRNNALFTASSTQGEVTAWSWASNQLAPLWSKTLAAPVTVAPVLDCARDSQGVGLQTTGTLYVALGGKLYAFIVDSPGLDPQAPWPKYQRDARNTGNPDAPLSACP